MTVYIGLQFINIHNHAGDSHDDTSRKMHFQRVMLKPSEDVICAKLVINLPAGFSEEGEVTLYESSDSDEHHRQLDKASVPSCHSTCWFELNVGENMADNMELLLEFTHRDTEFVERLNPMMVLYTYVEQSLPNFVTKRLATKSVSTRSQDDDDEDETYENQLLSDLDSTGDRCGKQTVQLDYSQLDWLGEDVTLISPTKIKFDFCHGHCNIPVNVLPHNDVEQGFDKRARILEIMNRLSEDRLTPPPCCIPLSYIANEVIYAVGDLVAMTTFPSVELCGCRA